MIEDVFEGLFKIIGRLIGYIIIEIVFELVIKIPGYYITKVFSKNNPDPDGLMIILVGFLFWAIIVAGVYHISIT